MTLKRTSRSPAAHGRPLLAALVPAAILLALTSHAAGAQAAAHARLNSSSGVGVDVLEIGGMNAGQLVPGSLVTTSAATQTTVSFETGLPSHPLTEFIESALSGRPRSVDAAIYEMDYEHKVKSEIDLHGARIQEVDFPQAFAASREVAKFAVKLFPAPGGTHPGTGQRKMQTDNNPQKKFLLADFLLQIPGVDCRWVSKVSIPPAVASAKGALIVQGTLSVRVASNHAADFATWLASPNPRYGTLTFLAPDLKTPLAVVRLAGMRIQSITTSGALETVTIAPGRVELAVP